MLIEFAKQSIEFELLESTKDSHLEQLFEDAMYDYVHLFGDSVFSLTESEE